MGRLKDFFIGIKHGFSNFSHTLMNIVNFILLFIVYFTAVAIVSIVSKISGKKYLDLKLDKNKKSYWLDKEITTLSLEEYYKQF